MALGGGDALARGARSAKFLAGGAKKGDKVIFRNRVVASEFESTPEVPTKPFATPKVDTSILPVTPRKKYRPLAKELLVRRATPGELSGTLVVPDSVEKEQPNEGIVLEVGRDVQEIAKGDQIVFGKYSGTEFRLNGETLLLMSEKEVKGILEEE